MQTHPDSAQDRRDRRFRAALQTAATRIGFDSSVIEPLRLHGAGLYLLKRDSVVGRTVEATEENRRRVGKALQVTTWLCEQGFPAVGPAADRLIEVEGTLVSFWHYVSQPEDAALLPVLATALGGLLRELHNLPTPPFEVPTVEPLERLHTAIQLDAGRVEPVLKAEDRRFLDERMAQAQQAYETLDFPLGYGLIHNDPHLGNLLHAAHSRLGYVLTDWEGAGWGPREIDLVQEGAPGNRFRDSQETRHVFTTAYGYDVASWSGWSVLRELRDLHSLAAYIRTAPAKPAARYEMVVRLGSLRSGDRSRMWTAGS